jgi:hypothetical protein
MIEITSYTRRYRTMRDEGPRECFPGSECSGHRRLNPALNCAGFERGYEPAGSHRRVAVGLALVLALISGIVWSNVSRQKGSELVRHTMEVESQLYRLLSLLEDAETGQRGYACALEISEVALAESVAGP